MDKTEDTGIKKIINCSYCGKSRHQVEQMVEGPEFSGKNIYICNECVDVTYNILHTEEIDVTTKRKKEKVPAPEAIKAYLDEYVIGQDGAKIAISVAVYNHYKRINNKSKTEIEKSNLLMIGESGCGKAQPLYSKIKIPGGWTTMGDIGLGDIVSTPNGKSANVVGVFPQGQKDIYKITFADGRTAESCKEHLWEIYGHYGESYKSPAGYNALRIGSKVVDLEWIMNRMKVSKDTIRISLIAPETTPDIELPIDPYVLGCLIGDGYLGGSDDRSIKLSSADDFILDKIRSRLVTGYTLDHTANYDYSLKGNIAPSYRRGDLHHYKIELKKLGLFNKLSNNKFIPDIYKLSSINQKLELIQGLIDTDGYCRKGNVSFTTVSEQLALDLQDMIRSLGGIVTIGSCIPKYTYKGVKKSGQRAYILSIRYKTPSDLVSLPRKKTLVETYQYSGSLKLAIKSIEYIGKEEAQCIMVDSDEHLYITDDYVVTHNTLAVKTIAKMFDLPYIIADATTLTEAGYVGEDVENLIRRLVANADDDLDKAKTGIIFIDEIDKKSRRSESATVSRDVSGEGVQQALLKLIEGTIVKMDDGFEEPVDFDTKDILFICSGSFVGLDEIIRKNRSKTSIGIGASLNTKTPFSQAIKNVQPDDLIKYGLIPEFVGRCPITVVFDDVTVDMLIRILKEPKNSIVEQFRALFKYEGVTLDFDDKYLLNIAQKCLTQKIGARGLRSIIERDLQAVQFILPSLAKSGVTKIVIDSEGIATHIYKTIKKKANG